MQEQATLYKITRNAASGSWIQVKTNSRASNNQPHLLFCGGFHSTMHGNKATFLAELAARNNWGFTRFDYLGHGASDGDAEHCSMHDWLADILAVIDSTNGELLLIGSSMGAWLATYATTVRTSRITALVTIAAAPDFTEKLLWPALSLEQQQAVLNNSCITVPTHYDGEDWRVRKILFDSGKELSLLNDSSALDITVPIRMVHGTADNDVPWTLSKQLLDRCSLSPDATLTLVSGGDHRLSDQRGLMQLENMLNEVVNLPKSEQR